MIKLIASDLDGTLFSSHMNVSSENLSAIKRAQANGIEFIVATGRSASESHVAFEKLGLKVAFINVNGAMVFDRKHQLVAENPLSKQQVRLISQILDDHGVYYEVITQHGTYSNNQPKRIQSFAELLIKTNKNLSLHEALKAAKSSPTVTRFKFVDDYQAIFDNPGESVMKFFIADSRGQDAFGEIKQQISQIDQVLITSSGENNIEVNHQNAQKGIALLEYAKLRGLNASEVAAIGDNFNDESMIKMAGLGIAMGNANPQVKQLADFVTKSNKENGVAYAIDQILASNRE